MVRTVHSMIRVASMAAMMLVVGAIALGRISPGPEGRTRGPAYLAGTYGVAT